MSDEMHRKSIEGATLIRSLACAGASRDALDAVVAGINNAITPILVAAEDSVSQGEGSSNYDPIDVNGSIHRFQSILAALQGKPLPASPDHA